jgi:hypothetical protein
VIIVARRPARGLPLGQVATDLQQLVQRALRERARRKKRR